MLDESRVVNSIEPYLNCSTELLLKLSALGCFPKSHFRYVCSELRWEIIDRFFENLFHGRFIYSKCFFQKSAEKKSPKKYFFHISFWCLTWQQNPDYSSNKPTHHPLENGDFYHGQDIIRLFNRLLFNQTEPFKNA